MAWYYGTFSCGHEGRVNITGPVKNRQWIADKKFACMCEDCYEISLEEERKRANEDAVKKAMEMELVELAGTEKQVAWANTLRQKLIDKFSSLLEIEGDFVFGKLRDKERYERRKERLDELNKKLEREDACEEDCLQYQEKIRKIKKRIEDSESEMIKKSDIILIQNYILNTFDSAVFYIDNRGKDVSCLIDKYKEEALKPKEQKMKEQQELELIEELKMEATVYPGGKVTNAVVEIENEDNLIKAKFEKNESFMELVKGLGFSWKDGRWRRCIGAKAGKVDDRMAELGNKLLNDGFPIRIMDKTIREKAINGEYEHEQTNWIDIRTESKYLYIEWAGYSTRLYKIAKGISGASWDRGMRVKVEHIDEIEEFARLYEFKFTGRALKVVEEYKKALKNIEVVVPERIEQKKQRDGLKEILDSSTEILHDLLDD